MKLPWKRGEAKSDSPMMVALSQLGSAHWGARSHEALMRDGYMRNAVAYRCVRMVAETAASVPLVVSHEGAGALLKRPMPDETCTDVLARAYAHLLIFGNAYLEALLLPDQDTPKGLQGLRPDRMNAELGQRGWVTGWTYKLGRKGAQDFDDAIRLVACVAFEAVSSGGRCVWPVALCSGAPGAGSA